MPDAGCGTFSQQDNRLSSDGLWTYSYDAVGNRTEKDSVSGSGEKWEYHYDDDNELVEVDHLNDGTHVDLRVDYQYDAWGNRVATSTDTDGDGYQALSQWASSVVGYSSQNSTSTAAKALGSPDATYGSSGSGWTPNTFFGTSNLTLAYTTPVYANGVTVVESGANGFVTEVDLIDTSNNAHVIWTGTDKTPQGSVGDFTISFEATSYQVEAVKIVIHQNIGTSPQIDAVSLHASGASTTTGSNADPVTVNYVLDGWNPMTQGGVGTSNVSVRMDVNASDGSLATRYLWSDQVDQLAGRVDYSGGGTTASVKWYVLDREDSIQEILDGSGKVIDALTYDAYGNILTETDPTQRGRYAWTGRELDAETGLQYNRARWYDPTVGSWVSQDPMGFAAGDSNLYRYVKNGPTNASDPSGKETYEETGERIGKDHDRLRNAVRPIDSLSKQQEIMDYYYLAGSSSLKTAEDKKAGFDYLQSLFNKANKAKGDSCHDWVSKVNTMKPSPQIQVEPVFWEYPIGIPFTNHWLGHAALKVTMPNGTIFYLDNGWWGNSEHIFGSSDIPSYVWTYKVPPPVPAAKGAGLPIQRCRDRDPGNPDIELEDLPDDPDPDRFKN